MTKTPAIKQHEARLTSWRDVEVEELNPHIGRQLMVGDNIMIARLLLKKGARVPRHNHSNEQLSYVLEGVLEFVVYEAQAGKPILVRAGEVLSIPPGTPHQVAALEDSISLDIFHPPRQDWIDKEDAYLRQPMGDEEG